MFGKKLEKGPKVAPLMAIAHKLCYKDYGARQNFKNIDEKIQPRVFAFYQKFRSKTFEQFEQRKTENGNERKFDW